MRAELDAGGAGEYGESRLSALVAEDGEPDED